jgi:2,4-dienoyl-CoA reductase-like NADH-dependent reductase (Old Yellow Enzyme family)
MSRHHYKIFSPATLGTLTLPNRLVRSATWDPAILGSRRVGDETLAIYHDVAAGGVGMVITGSLPVVPDGMLDAADPAPHSYHYEDIRIDGTTRIADMVHRAAESCAVIAQLDAGPPGLAPSEIPSPFRGVTLRAVTSSQIRQIVQRFVEGIACMKGEGYDGVQLHAAHGTPLSCFLSPYTHRRTDEYGGSVAGRARIVREIVSQARDVVGDYPLLIKMNATDYVEGGIDSHSFAALAQEIERAGVDAIEVSGGMVDCLVRSQAELGFRPVLIPEAHTRIRAPHKQSYFLPFAEKLNLSIPVILVGGNRDVERLERIVQGGSVDFVALCRPLIREPDLPRRWLEGVGSPTTACISCNSCLYSIFVHPGRTEPGPVICLHRHDSAQHRAAQAWLAAWVSENRN